jgi:hypothetical protein
MESLDIIIKDVKLVVLLPLNATIADLSAVTTCEYRLAYPHRRPLQIMHIKDGLDRILGTNIPLFHGNKCRLDQLECITEDLASMDRISGSSIVGSYRSWQLWTLEQISSSLDSYQDSQDEGSTHDARKILSEIVLSDDRQVQLLCLRCFYIILSKYSGVNGDDHTDFAISHFINLIASSAYFEVVDEGFNCMLAYFAASEDKLRQAQGNLPIIQQIPSRIHIDAVLVKFPDHQGILLQKYKSLVAAMTMPSKLLRTVKARQRSSSSSKLSTSHILSTPTPKKIISDMAEPSISLDMISPVKTSPSPCKSLLTPPRLRDDEVNYTIL